MQFLVLPTTALAEPDPMISQAFYGLWAGCSPSLPEDLFLFSWLLIKPFCDHSLCIKFMDRTFCLFVRSQARSNKTKLKRCSQKLLLFPQHQLHMTWPFNHISKIHSTAASNHQHILDPCHCWANCDSTCRFQHLQTALIWHNPLKKDAIGKGI